ncbi:hypothetical protein ACI79C_09600 [Geodermatophilus sp. SYSU D00697]
MATPQAGRVLRSLRWFTLGSGPLKRGSDRVEFLARLLVLAVVLLSVPVALAVGTAVRSDLASAAARQAGELTRTSATALVDADGYAASTPPASHGHGSVVPARWTTPAGAQVEEQLPAPTGTRAGDEFPIWTTAEGLRAEEPMSSSDVTLAAVVPVVLGWSAGLAVTALAHSVLCWVLGRQRDRQWAREWAAVEPTWTRRVS